MAKSASKSLRSEPAVPLVGGKGRAAEHHGTFGVSDLPQAKTADLKIARQFDLSQRGQGANKLPERPRTSNGPARNFSSTRRNLDKKETRDDLHLNVNPLAAHGKGTTFYDFPLPGSSPQSATIPRSLSPAPFPQRKSSLAGSIRSRHSGSVKEEIVEMEDPMNNIGMALGSPSHPPAQLTQTPWNQNQTQSQNQTPNQNSQHVRFNNVRVASPEEMDGSIDGWDRVDASAPPTKQKSKWSLGRLFGGGKKYAAPSTQPFYQVQPENGVQKQATGSSDFGSPPVSANEKSKGRGRTNSERKDIKNKPDMKRANTAPHRGPTDFEYRSEGKSTPQLMLDGGPMLDVDIPSVQMERYSVMFGSVLKPNASSSSALLARRQATLEKLKTVNEALREKERELEEKEEQLLRPRRATSPQPGKSPAFSLFPNTPSRLHARDTSPSTPHNRSPLQRSNTAPSVSPSRANFEASRRSNAEPVPKVKPGLKAPPIIPPQKPLSRSLSNSNGKPKHQPIITQFSQEESHLDLTSPHGSVMSYENDVYDPSPLPMLNMKPTIVSPAWEMINPHPTAGTGSTSSGSTLNSASSAATSVNSPLDTLAVPRGRAGTITNSTISTTSMEVPIAFAQPPTRDRIPAVPSRLKTSTEATDVPAPSRPAIQGHHKSDSAVASLQKGNPLAQSLLQTSHSKDDSISGLSIVSSKGEIVGLSEDEQRIINAADVSIARQISVSRQQRQLLIPIKKFNSTSPSPTSQNGSSTSLSTSNQRSPNGPDLNQPSPLGSNKYGPSVISMPINLTGGADHTSRPRIKVKTELTGLGERLVDSPVRALTPTVVVVPGPADIRKGPQVRKGSPVGAGNTGGLTVGGGNMELQHRKSARGVVEHA